MIKEFQALKIGDVIWANSNDIGKHIFIIYNLNTDGNYECLPSVSLSSNCSNCEDCCIPISGIDIPNDWFKIKKDTSYIRIDNPICLNKNEYSLTSYSYKGNLKKCYPDLWNKICTYDTPITSEVCECIYD